MAELLRPGGRIVVEDADASANFNCCETLGLAISV
jgi:hypothetical protein